jgi:hypothetical protein
MEIKMTNAQFAIWIAKQEAPQIQDEVAEKVYKWLESKEEAKEPGWNSFMSEYLKDEVAKYKDVPTVVVKKEDSNLMKDLKDAVVLDKPDGSWMNQYYSDYIKLRESGMMFEFHPTWTGQWGKDKYAFCYEQKNRKK